MALGENCAECPYRECPVVVSEERRRGALVALIGEGPAEWEVNHAEGESRGKCFVGPSGWELEKTLARAGIARSEVAITNAHECARDDKGGVREVRAVYACRERLCGFLHGVQPRSVLLLGGKALRSVCPGFVASPTTDGLLRHRGSLWSRGEIEAACVAVGESSILPESVEWVMATIHPAAIIRRERLEKQSAMAFRMIPAMDLKRLLKAIKKGRELLEMPEIEYHPPHFKPGEGFVFDIETNAARRPVLIGVQDSKGGPVFSLGWQETGREWAEEYMRDPGLLKVGHNIQGFDLRVLEAEGIEVTPPYEDTMALGGLCEPDLPRGLGFQSALYFGHRRPFWKELDGADTRKPHEVRAQTALRAAWGKIAGKRIVFEEEWAGFYNALDVDSTRVLYHELRETCRREGWA